MIKLIIICCEVVMINMGVRSYSYEAGYTNDSKRYTVTIFTTQKYEVGDTIGTFDMYPKIDLSDTMVFYNN
jgi:hypothetical protein